MSAQRLVKSEVDYPDRARDQGTGLELESVPIQIQILRIVWL